MLLADVLKGTVKFVQGGVGPILRAVRRVGYEKDGDTLFPKFDNGTAIEVKIV